jgi:hypothetical protein
MTNEVGNIVDNIVTGKVSDASEMIKSIINSKVAGEIESYKKEFAATMFNDETESTE